MTATDRLVTVTVEDGTTFTAPLADLFRDDDGLAEEAEDIIACLDRGGIFLGGGGASPEYTIKAA